MCGAKDETLGSDTREFLEAAPEGQSRRGEAEADGRGHLKRFGGVCTSAYISPP
jgi:hypothetical protein